MEPFVQRFKFIYMPIEKQPHLLSIVCPTYSSYSITDILQILMRTISICEIVLGEEAALQVTLTVHLF